jgi:serine/threonine protein kinase
MGPRASSASQGGDYEALLRDYEVVKQVEHEGLLYLKSRSSGTEQLLREFTFNDKREFDRHVELLERRRVQLGNCKYVVGLEKLLTKSEDQYCSTFYKIYALFQFTDRTLQDEVNERNLQKRKFQEKELWSILASCILGLSHLQKQTIKHQSLRSDSILISQDGVVKIYDPICTGAPTNYDALIAKRTTPHIYLSPELTESLQLEAGQPHCHAYKSDIWTLGMIILEVGLGQYQDECYRD